VGKVSGRASSLDRDGGVTPRRTEEVIELTYQAQATPGLTPQPDLQYVVNPGLASRTLPTEPGICAMSSSRVRVPMSLFSLWKKPAGMAVNRW